MTALPRFSVIVIIIISASWALLSCSESETPRTVPSGETSKPTVPIYASLDTGQVYELPVATLLYPEPQMDTASDSSLAELLVIPVGGKIKVLKTEIHNRVPWYAVAVLGGPRSGWTNVAGQPMDSLMILGLIAQSGGIPGWIDHRDIEDKPMRYAPAVAGEEPKGK